MNERRWEFSGGLDGWEVLDPAARPVTWQGRPALKLEGGDGVLAGALFGQDLGLEAFRLEADVALPQAGFAGLIFAAQGAENFEMVYICPGDAGEPAWIQYDPTMNGSSTWQIYHSPRYQARVPIALWPRPGEWVHLALDVRPDRVAIFVGNSPAPQLVVAPLQSGSSRGRIGLWGYGPGYVSDLSIRPIGSGEPLAPATPAGASPDPIALAAVPPAALVPEWRVCGPFPPGEADRPPQPAAWRRASVEENGTLNLNRRFVMTGGAVAWAYAEAYCERAGMGAVTCGFSDRLRLWVNGEAVYRGDWRWAPPESDGRIRPEFARLPVPLRADWNTLLAEVSALEPAYGWGLALGVDGGGQPVRYRSGDIDEERP